MPTRRVPTGFRGVPPKRSGAPTNYNPFDLLGMMDELRKMFAEFKTGLETVKSAVKMIEAIKEGKPGMPGARGSDGANVTEEQVQTAVRAMYVQPKDAVAATAEEVATEVLKDPRLYKFILKRMQTPATQDDEVQEEKNETAAIQKMFEEFTAKMEKEMQNRMAEVRNFAAMNKPQGESLAGKQYGVDTWARGGGDTVKAGTNVTITTDANGKKVISVTPAALAIIAVSGTIDDSNKTFTAASQPTLLNINGSFYAPTGGNITWTYVAGTITLSSLIGTGGSIFGV